jgi:hypothetical protein
MPDRLKLTKYVIEGEQIAKKAPVRKALFIHG